MNKLQSWIAAASIPQRDRLVRLAKTTLGSLHQLAGAYRTNGKLRATPELAAAVEKAAFKISIADESLPVIHREDLCPACGKCELAKIARSSMAEGTAKVQK